jgi:hypothetical protein
MERFVLLTEQTQPKLTAIELASTGLSGRCGANMSDNPANRLFVVGPFRGYIDDTPVVSAPGCFRSAKPNVVDVIWPPILSRYRVSAWESQAWAIGASWNKSAACYSFHPCRVIAGLQHRKYENT